MSLVLDCYLWRKKSDRHKGNLPGQVYSYPTRRWRFEDSVSTQITMKGLLLLVTIFLSFDLFLYLVPEKVAEPSNGLSSGMVQTLEGGMVTKRSSRIAGLKKEDSSKLGCINHPSFHSYIHHSPFVSSIRVVQCLISYLFISCEYIIKFSGTHGISNEFRAK